MRRGSSESSWRGCSSGERQVGGAAPFQIRVILPSGGAEKCSVSDAAPCHSRVIPRVGRAEE